MELPPPQNHVFVDFENVHQVDHSVIGRKTVSFTLLVGAKQTKLDLDVVEKMLEHASSVQLVRISRSGKNGLDFTLAYYVGRAVAADPLGFFHIISKDKGYDALVEHLQSRRTKIRRYDSFSSLTFTGPAKPATPPTTETPPITPHGCNGGNGKSPTPNLIEGALKFADHLKSTKNRPKKRTTLLRHITAHLGHGLTEPEADAVARSLESVNLLEFTEKGLVSYRIE